MVAHRHHPATESREQRARLKDKAKKDWTTAAYGENYLTPDEWAESFESYEVDSSTALDVRNAVLDVVQRYGQPKYALEELFYMMKHSTKDNYEANYYNNLERENDPEGFYYNSEVPY